MFVTFSSAVCGDHLYLHRLTHSIPSRRPSDRTRFRDQLWTGIAADHLCAVFRQLLAEHTVAAAEVENALAGLWREPVDQIRSKIGHERPLRAYAPASQVWPALLMTRTTGAVRRDDALRRPSSCQRSAASGRSTRQRAGYGQGVSDRVDLRGRGRVNKKKERSDHN